KALRQLEGLFARNSLIFHAGFDRPVERRDMTLKMMIEPASALRRVAFVSVDSLSKGQRVRNDRSACTAVKVQRTFIITESSVRQGEATHGERRVGMIRPQGFLCDCYGADKQWCSHLWPACEAIEPREIGQAGRRE